MDDEVLITDIANEYFCTITMAAQRVTDEVYYPNIRIIKNKHSGILTPSISRKHCNWTFDS